MYLGITQKKKAFADPDYVEEMERRKQEKVLAEMSRQERYKDAKQIHTRLYLLLQNCNLHSIEKCPCAGTQGTLISECYDIQWYTMYDIQWYTKIYKDI